MGREGGMLSAVRKQGWMAAPQGMSSPSHKACKQGQRPTLGTLCRELLDAKGSVFPKVCVSWREGRRQVAGAAGSWGSRRPWWRPQACPTAQSWAGPSGPHQEWCRPPRSGRVPQGRGALTE